MEEKVQIILVQWGNFLENYCCFLLFDFENDEIQQKTLRENSKYMLWIFLLWISSFSRKKRGGISRIFLLFFILFSSSCMLKQFFCPFLPRQKNIDFRNHPHLPNFLALFCKQNQSTIRIVHMQGEMPSI